MHGSFVQQNNYCIHFYFPLQTFVFGQPGTSKKSEKSPGIPKPKPVLNRRTRLKLQEQVPRKLDFHQFAHLNSLWKAYIADLCGYVIESFPFHDYYNKVILNFFFLLLSAPTLSRLKFKPNSIKLICMVHS
jgi:hypothetical protein